MILEQIQNSFKGESSEYEKSCGLSVVVSGHLLVVNPRYHCGVPSITSLRGRGRVGEFSASSACRMRRYLRECLAEYCNMVTLTYPAGLGTDGARAKRDIKAMLQRMRRYVGDSREYGTFWFLEFQERGAVHFHLFTTHFFPKEWIALSWYQVVGSEDQRHLRAGTRIERIKSGKRGMCAYASKYAAKQQQKILPESFGWVGRFWGAVGRRRVGTAGALIHPSSVGLKAVERRIRTIEDTIETAVFQNQAKVISKPCSSGVVIYMKNDWLVTTMRMLVELLDHTQDTFNRQRSIWYPELEHSEEWEYDYDIE